MPDPVWTSTYNYSQTPEANGFTRTLYDNPVVNTVTGGAAAQRRVEVNSNNGSAVFLTSNVPSLAEANGCTAEMVVANSGPGDAGFEVTFLNHVFGVRVYTDKVMIDSVTNDPSVTEVAVAASVGDRTLRVTLTPDTPDPTTNRTLRVYLNGALIHTSVLNRRDSAFQRFLWWGEEGGTQIFRQMKLYIGGPVAPG